ncbi:EboA domain-containing protein [Pedobacter sp. JY14-1]|uniref:EboA domain-containing protein n=1 Tax=Pedobacter sp. JY14-1 TaxID=3034151 RepID=UPI0023E3041A|nr:EboA domain-containing protein [Pedobacter sp. JY14-1]
MMLTTVIAQIIRRNTGDEAMDWLEQKAALIRTEERSLQLNLAFAHTPRYTEKKNLQLEPQEVQQLADQLPGVAADGWTADRLARVWLLMQVPAENKDAYLKKIDGLFAAAEMNEQVALYSALPVFSFPEAWLHRCTEGIRSNIGTVLEAIMYHNPYPAGHLPEPAWNQLVLKAFFTEKDVTRIIGFEERANHQLSETLKDYVQERTAAHRTIHPEIHKLIEQ